MSECYNGLKRSGKTTVEEVMRMIPYERRQQMLRELENREILTLEEFCGLLNGVSESTIRRDMKTLEAEGRIITLRGGAAKLKVSSYDTPVNSRNLLNTDQKEIIARFAAEMVDDGEMIYADAGSTVMRMMKYLKNKNITVVTSSAIVFQEVDGSKLDCIIVGGDLNIPTASIVGPLADNMLMNMFFDKAFIGASGFSSQAGINTPDNREANKKRIVKNNSKEVYVLADSSKSGKTTLCKAFDLDEATIISEKLTPVLEQSDNYIIAK